MPATAPDPFPTPLIAVDALAAMLEAAAPRAHPSLLDVRWQVTTGADRQAYLAGHIPGAAFVDLDTQLSAPPGPGGRHPLPTAEAFTDAMRAAGVHAERPVVVYDDAASITAARAWWLLRYFGHAAVAVLDGGLAAWTAAGHALERESATPAPTRGDFTARPGGMPIVDAEQAAALPAAGGVLIDARDPQRYAGEVEPIDPVAGHIPGAVNRPTTANVEAKGHFLSPADLRAAFARLGIDAEGAAVAAYCGSGVAAAHEVLALELAGRRAALYPGSWSDWITDPDRPVAQTAQP
jgi:thiosulfate/3-mercaptopyruvate sulfurtransferase